ncbi:MAG: hypothetical protein K2L16_04940, partial [Muribaculaceae bacterium]|nr:hypothetical protein [Muribaculaceae bacterium]
VNDRIGGQHRQLEYYRGQLPALARTVLVRAGARLGDNPATLLGEILARNIDSRRRRLDSAAELLEALSPEATLRRGYSITRVGGKAVTDSGMLAAGDEIETTFAAGPAIKSTVK